MWHVIGLYRVALILFSNVISHSFAFLNYGTKTYSIGANPLSPLMDKVLTPLDKS